MSILDNFVQNPILMSIDILLMTYLIYVLIKFAKKTRAMAVLNGVLLIIVVKLLSDAFRLYALSFVIDQVITWGVIAIIIIFQPEIRRSLEQLGNTMFLKKNSVVQQNNETVDSLVEASKYLSKRYIGALICIENRVNLRQYVNTGVPLNANISSQLLINIFTPNTPLHDGAVIIKQDDILAASCVLPLTENKDIPQELGTRHRAGLGLSEQTDAFTIIVSEETGDISVAFDNQLYRRLNEEDLVDLLQRHVYKTQDTKSSQTIWQKIKISKVFGGRK